MKQLKSSAVILFAALLALALILDPVTAPVARAGGIEYTSRTGNLEGDPGDGLEGSGGGVLPAETTESAVDDFEAISLSPVLPEFSSRLWFAVTRSGIWGLIDFSALVIPDSIREVPK